MASSEASSPPQLAWAACAVLALAAPALLAFNLAPSATFLNQAVALVGWGGFLLVLTAMLPAGRHSVPPGMTALLAALVLLGAAALAAPMWAGAPWSLALSGAGMILAAALAVLVAASAQADGSSHAAFRAFCIGLVVAGILSSAVGIVQVFAPDWPDGDWVARTYIPGGAVGNMRQPNHLSSLLVWALVAAIWLIERSALQRWLGSVLVLLFVFVIMLSGSRTGAFSVGLLVVWGLADRRLSRNTRILLIVSLVAYGVFWLAVSAWADYGHHVVRAESRFSTKGDISSSRGKIWSNTLALIRMHPWAGVGFGEFNFAWTLTPFPNRPVAFFDHTHNILLQFAVELGLPLAGLVTLLMAYALYCAWRNAARDPTRRAALVMVLMILLHSMLEYPLWYAYFLLPAAFAFGICLGPSDDERARAAPTARPGTRPLLIASMLMMLGGVASVADYRSAVVIYAPPEDAPPLAQRIRDGQRSVLFAHQADYAAATTAAQPSDAMDSFRRAPHNLLDARLLIAWAKALAESGDVERARYVAQRLKEFRNDQAADFFAPCSNPPPRHGAALPFQCEPPSRTFTYADFR
jgi:O-antigen ligase